MGAKIVLYKGKKTLDVFSPVAADVQIKLGWKREAPVVEAKVEEKVATKTEDNGSDTATTAKQSD